MMPNRCDNCTKVWSDEEIIPLEACDDLGERLDPGSVVPSGECPECLTFVYKEG